jgi:hypothetical protein
MRHMLAVLTALTAGTWGCGRDGATTQPTQLRPSLVRIVSGDGQHDTVTRMLPAPIEVLVTASPSGRLSLSVAGPQGVSAQVQSAGVPVPNQLVNWVVVEEGCGRPFAGSALTDSLGRAKERWELGTKAGLCHMEARAVDQATGEPIVFDTATAIALAGTPKYLDFNWQAAPATMAPGDTLDLRPLFLWAMDAYGNYTMSADSVPVPQWGWYDPSGGVPPAPQGEGWRVPALPAGCRHLYVWMGDARWGRIKTCLST